jgi:hypothetical protein
MVAAQLFGLDGAPNLGRFQLLNRLGAGGMGVVYTAYDPQLDRTVAVKLLRASEPRGSAAMEEGRALARLSHPQRRSCVRGGRLRGPHNNIGVVENAWEHVERARPAFERAAREAEGVIGPGAGELPGRGPKAPEIADRRG